MPATKLTPKKSSKLFNIIWISLITGTLDGLATLLVNYKVNPTIVFKFIACGVFGKPAINGGVEMVVAGVFFHYLIAFLFTGAFYLLYPAAIKIFQNKYTIAVIYGLAAWLIMNLMVIPLSKIGFHQVKFQFILIGILTLIICIGMPIALIANVHYRKGMLDASK